MSDKVEAIKVWPGGRRELRMTETNNIVSASRAKSQLDRGSAVYVTRSGLSKLERIWVHSKKIEANDGEPRQ